MDYLMYIKGGVIKKFPLDKKRITIGRGFDCDIVLDESVVSKSHCRVEPAGEQILVTDMKSKNGTFVSNRRIKEAKIDINASFGIGHTEFYFKRGNIKEFAVSRELSVILATMIRAKRPDDLSLTETKEAENSYQRLLPLLVEKAVQTGEFPDFLEHLRELLNLYITQGALYLSHHGRFTVIFDHLGGGVMETLRNHPPEEEEGNLTTLSDGNSFYFWRFRHDASDIVLLYCSRSPYTSGGHYLADFLQKVLEIIVFNLRLVPSISFDPSPPPVLFAHPELSIIGKSAAIRHLVDITGKIAPKSAFVLILGESGTGKELFAKMIHLLSERKSFVALNCAAIPATLLESELFGHEAGAFTDAKRRKIGKIEESSGGTLVLDEIGDMPLETQAKLLRTIQEQAVTRLGSNETIPVDLRIIAMTNQDLYRLVEEKKFRQDLFFRLRIHEMKIPPLRERRDDIPGLVNFFTRRYAELNRVWPAGYSESVSECFQSYSWPGNIRELENEIRKVLEIIDEGELISDQHITPSILDTYRCEKKTKGDTSLPYKEKVDRYEKEQLIRLLEKHNGNKSEVARTVGLTYQGLLKKMKKLGLDNYIKES